jgi:hypothetical protein
MFTMTSKHRHSLPTEFHGERRLITEGYFKMGECTVNGVRAERFTNGQIGGMAIHFEPSRPFKYLWPSSRENRLLL